MMLRAFPKPLALAALALLAGCNDCPTSVTVVNRSGILLQSLVIAGTGFETRSGDLVPGQSAKACVDPNGESGLAMSFVANDRPVALPPAGYFERGYSATVVVNPDLTASVDSKLPSY
jgi:hypothetical protein